MDATNEQHGRKISLWAFLTTKDIEPLLEEQFPYIKPCILKQAAEIGALGAEMCFHHRELFAQLPLFFPESQVNQTYDSKPVELGLFIAGERLKREIQHRQGRSLTL